MARNLLNQEISELCLGKPTIRSAVTTSTSVKDALAVLKKTDDSHVSVWRHGEDHQYWCIGKICIADVVCFLCKENNLADPSVALEANVKDLLPKVSGIVKYLQPNASILEAIDCMVEGTHNIVIPKQDHRSSNSIGEAFEICTFLGFSYHKKNEYCWLTHQDVARFLLNSIGAFSPIPAYRIDWLNIIERKVMTIHYDDPASLALPLISRAITEQTCVAVTDDGNKFIGEISTSAISYCDETLAAAILTLSAGELLAYIDCDGPPEDLIQLVNMRLEYKGLSAMLQAVNEQSSPSSGSSTMSSTSCSSDDESGTFSKTANSSGRSSSASAWRSEAIMCYPWSSLMAVMVQALTHQATCIWVVDDDQTLVGLVTFQAILDALRHAASNQHKDKKNSSKQ